MYRRCIISLICTLKVPMFSIVRTEELHDLKSINIAIDYMVNNPSEIRDEYYGCNFTDFINRSTDKEIKSILMVYHNPVGFISGYNVAPSIFVISYFEIFYPFRGKRYTKGFIDLLEKSHRHIVISKPLSIMHWIAILGTSWFRKQILDVGIVKYMQLMNGPEPHLRPNTVRLLKRLLYDHGDMEAWSEYEMALKEEMVTPIITAVTPNDLPEPSIDMIITNGDVIVGLYRYNGSFVPVPPSLEKMLERQGYKVIYSDAYCLPSYPQPDQSITIVLKGVTYDLNYLNQVYDNGILIGTLLGRHVIE